MYENWMDITFVTESILITSSVSKVVQSTLCTFYITISKQTLKIFLIYGREKVFNLYAWSTLYQTLGYEFTALYSDRKCFIFSNRGLKEI